MRRKISLVASATALATSLAVAPQAVAAPPSSFGWTETTMAEARKALVTGRISCEELVQGYLDRIAAYDDELNSFITVNPDALAQAEALDDGTKPNMGAKTGDLYCMPIVLKDNIDAVGMPTTAGAAALATSTPPDDAFVTEQLKEEGAIIIGKANLDEFAFGFGGRSALGGQANNPYDLTRGPGGSSSGTGVSVSASLAMAGLGSDTGGSIRVPSSVNGLVGIRPTMRLLSQDGVVPLAHFQDTVGPMCRVVADCATLLEALVGFDPASTSGQYTLPQQRQDTGVLIGSAAEYASIVGDRADAYTKAVHPQGLRNARIGVVRDLFGSDPEVLAVMDAAIAAMRAAGATVEDVTIADLAQITAYPSMSSYEFRDNLEEYLQSWPSDADGHPQTFEEVAAAATDRSGTFAFYGPRGEDRLNNPEYIRNTEERPEFVRSRLTAALDNTDLEGNVLGKPYDALLYPSVISLPRVGSSPSSGSNNRLSPFSGYPALSMPAGFAPATAEHPVLPVGMELLGREFDEPTLIKLASGYERAVAGTELARQAPATTPELVPAGR